MRTVELGVIAGVKPVLGSVCTVRRGVILKKSVRDAGVADKMAKEQALEFHPYICWY